MITKKIFLFIFTIFLLILLLFVIIQSHNSSKNSTTITTSFYPIYFFTSQIAGDKLTITNITPNGIEPHDYELSPIDIIKIQNSKLLIMNGLLEPWEGKIKDNLKNKNTKILTIIENQTDPHTWLSPKLAKLDSQKILRSLKEIDPTNFDYYSKKEKELEMKLDQLDMKYKTDLANCTTRTFVTSHEAFGYLAKEYNLNQVAISGISPDEEPSLAQLAQVANIVKKNNIKYIFFETLVSPKLSETIANETGAQTLTLDPIEGLTDNTSSYLTQMDKNLQNLKTALECK